MTANADFEEPTHPSEADSPDPVNALSFDAAAGNGLAGNGLGDEDDPDFDPLDSLTAGVAMHKTRSGAPAQPGSASAEPESGPIAREVQFLAELAQLAADRAKNEANIESSLQADRLAAEQAKVEGEQALAAWLEREARDLVAAYDLACRTANEDYIARQAAADRKIAELQTALTAKLEPARAAAAKALADERAAAERKFDAVKQQAPRQLEAFEAQINTWRTRVESDRTEAVKLLASWRRSPNSFPTTAEIPPASGDLAAQLQDRVALVTAQLEELKQLSAPAMAASRWFIWICLFLSAAAAGGAFFALGPIPAGVAGGVTLLLGLLIKLMVASSARSQIGQILPVLLEAARTAETLLHKALEHAKTRTAETQGKLIEQREAAYSKAEQRHQKNIATIDAERERRIAGPTAEHGKLLAELLTRRNRALAEAGQQRKRRETERLTRQKTEAAACQERYTRTLANITARHAQQWNELVEQWKTGLERLQTLAEHIRTGIDDPAGGGYLADWSHWVGKDWQSSVQIPPALRHGQFRVRRDQIPGGVPADPRLAAVTPEEFWLPALVPFPTRASLIFKARGATGRQAGIDALQAAMLRVLLTIPAGKVRFTIVDPVGLGENFSAFMHLGDFNEALVTSRIWTDPRHIEARLLDISEHMENVIQKYLRNEFQSIEEYNRDAGEIAEPFRFLVIANYPAGFSEAAQRRLLSIASSGARCGVYILLTADTQTPLSQGLSLSDLEAQANVLYWHEDRFLWKDDRFGEYDLVLDAPPPPANVTALLQTAGRLANDAGKVEVPFEVIAPPATEYWTSSAAKGLDVPLGRAGATRLQSLKLGKGTSQHVLIAGKTGSGKSTLLHALITNAALRYSPDEVELYLIDFKQGVEFKTYATHHLPHVRVVAIESDREFGVSVLGRLDVELKMRADRFRDLGVQDLNGFRQAAPGEPLARTLLIIDEFQEFFTEDDKISQDAALLLDRLVRQGRAFGIHVLLGSQTLAGAFSLARSTLGQMAVRIALQCSEADAHMILSEDNSAARLLTRAGEAIYNDSNGMIEGNHPFQVVWLPDERREVFLDAVQQQVKSRNFVPRPQVVFEGNVPAEPENNEQLGRLLTAERPVQAPAMSTIWLGDAVAIKDPTEIGFRRQSASNLLMVGQNEEAALGIVATALVALAAQQPAILPDAPPRFHVFDGTVAESPSCELLATLPKLVGHNVRVIGARELTPAITEISAELARRQAAGDGDFPQIFVVIFGLQKLREFRKAEDDFGFSRGGDAAPNPAKQLVTLLRDGPSFGVHTIAWCDSVTNMNRSWDRQTLREFEMRVAFQMSGNDSSTLIDSPVASRLGPRRALYTNEEQGVMEKFRPYRWPGEEWLVWVRQRLGIQ